MRKRRIKIWSTLIGAVIIAVCAVGIIDVHHKYFFNPLTFRNNDVLYLPWKWYTKPLNMQIYTMTGPSKIVTVQNSSQIKKMINELEKDSAKKDAIPQMVKLTGPAYGIVIRTHNSKVLQTVILYPDARVAQIATQQGNVFGYELLPLSSNLLQYVQDQLGKDD